MDTIISTIHKYKRSYKNTSRILVILVIGFLATGSALAQVEYPWMIAFPENNAVEGWEWPEDAIVYLTIDNAPEGFIKEGISEVTSWGDPRTWVRFEFWEDYDLQVGDKVTLTDEFGTSTTHQVQPLSITAVDVKLDTVAGTADVGAQLQVWIHGQEDPPVEVTVAGDRTWLASLGGDITFGTGGRSWVITEGGNATAVDWYVPNPHFTVFPEWEWYDGYDWPDGVPVTITVDGKEECETEGESSGGFFNGGFPEGCDVAVGDIVRFEDGETFREHEVQDLSISKVDPEDNIIKGTANPGAEVHVWPHATGEEEMVIANPKGKWNVDFTGTYDLMPGDGGRAEIRDEFGNATAVDWYIPQPRFTIFPDAQWFDGIDWPDGAVITISVKNKPECTFERESWGNFFNGDFPEGCVIVARDRVTFTDGKIIRKHTVQNLAILIVDEEENTVSGIADSGKVVHLWVWNSADGSFVDGSDLEVTAVDGEWLVDYDDVGLDLQIGMGIQAEIRDENGNATSVDLLVPDPRMVASLSENWVYFVDFIPGSTLTLSIIGADWELTSTADVNGFAWINLEGWELKPDDRLVVTDGNTKKELVVEGFTFDVFDLTNGHLAGTAPEPFGRTVWAGFGYEDGGWSQYVTTDGTGAWLADYGGPIPPDYWWVWAQIFDDDGDATELRPALTIWPD